MYFDFYTLGVALRAVTVLSLPELGPSAESTNAFESTREHRDLRPVPAENVPRRNAFLAVQFPRFVARDCCHASRANVCGRRRIVDGGCHVSMKVRESAMTHI